jgi:hypothetical protein
VGAGLSPAGGSAEVRSTGGMQFLGFFALALGASPLPHLTTHSSYPLFLRSSASYISLNSKSLCGCQMHRSLNNNPESVTDKSDFDFLVLSFVFALS